MKQETFLRTIHNLTHHAPKNDDNVKKIEAIRAGAKIFLGTLNENCVDSRELSLALTHLEEVAMWAIASVVRNQNQEEVRRSG